MIVKNQSEAGQNIASGVERKILSRGGSLMAVEFTFKKGAVGEVHTHPHEQIGYIVEGRFELETDGEKEILGPGDTYYIAPNVPHGVLTLEDGKVFDVFNPHRQDFLTE